MGEVSGSVGSRRPLPLAVPLAIGATWALAVAAAVSGKAGFLDHDALLDHGPSIGVAVALFLLSWLAMIVAMMLPSSLPMIHHYANVAARQGHPDALRRFLAGYALVWISFGYLAFGGDLGLHHIAGRNPWITAHPWVVAGSVLVAAGAFQFTALKERCLTQCRHPAAYLMRQQLRGVEDPLRLGIGHGLDCLGCCWALMLLMFAAGVANLAWMAALAGVMLYEKVAPSGRRLTPMVGVVLVAWGAVVIWHPTWLPPVLAGVS